MPQAGMARAFGAVFVAEALIFDSKVAPTVTG
jgi:hypothetical protein